MKGRILGVLFLVPKIIFGAAGADVTDPNATVRVVQSHESHTAGYQSALDQFDRQSVIAAERDAKRKARRQQILTTMAAHNPLARTALELNKQQEAEEEKQKAELAGEIDRALFELDAAIKVATVRDCLDSTGNLVQDPQQPSAQQVLRKQEQEETEPDPSYRDNPPGETKTGSGTGTLNVDYLRQLQEARGVDTSYRDKHKLPSVAPDHVTDGVDVDAQRTSNRTPQNKGCLSCCVVM